jgi:extracellular elastinolytic metalloproteinase
MIMTRKEFDVRDFSKSRATAPRERALNEAAKEVSEKLPGNWTVKVEKLDHTTGNPSGLVSKSAPTAVKGNYIQRTIEFLNSVKPVQGFEKDQATEFKPDPVVQKTSSNVKTVHVQQTIGGIPIFQTGLTVRFDANDAIEGAVGNTITITETSEISPKLSAKDAVMKVAKYLEEPDADEQETTDQFGEPLSIPRIDLANFEPKVDVILQSDPSKTTFFEKGPFASKIRANMIWFERAPNDLRLCWEVATTMPDFAGQYTTIVDANTGEVLYNQQTMLSLRARMNVFRVNGGNMREALEIPLGLDSYPLSNPSPPPLPNGFPHDWCDDDGKSVGNSTLARLGHFGGPIQGTVRNGNVIFDPVDPTGDDQKVLNIFYYCCYMHDYFYLLGFREPSVNFQRDNLGRGGTGGDSVDARSHPGRVTGTANMGRSVEGESPIMNMGMVTRTNRHTAFDSDVVFHEFTHGVANRLVGGGSDRNSLDSLQSRCFNEGNSDYFACTVNKKTTVGGWVVNNPRGFRNNAYDSNFPHNFGHLGTMTDGINYGFVPTLNPPFDPHNGGEIWCATVMEMNRNIGDELGTQLVVDALKLVQTNPSFLNMRDSILAALDHKLRADPPMDRSEYKEAWNGIWKAFAKFGMGPAAQSNGAQLTGIRADFSVPTFPT